MDVHEAIRTRRSVRDYGDTPIPDEALMKVLEAARLAPSASNQQNWRFIVVKEESRRKGIAHAASNQMWIAGAPVVIAAVATEPRSIMTCGVPRYAVDLAIAIDHITLAAAAEGLGTCWIAGAAGTGRVRRLHGRHRHAPWLSSLSGRNQVAEEAGGHSPLRDGLPIAADAVLDQGRQEDSNDSDQEYAIKQSCAAYRDDSREPLNPIEVQQVCPNECA